MADAVGWRRSVEVEVLGGVEYGCGGVRWGRCSVEMLGRGS